ncbi:hypothetical protein INR49_016687 [Caranx melampygus]|nr:hypothetical protein INR49_016687 [Caranx melampygus]
MIQVKSIHTLIPHHAAWPAGAVPQERHVSIIIVVDKHKLFEVNHPHSVETVALCRVLHDVGINPNRLTASRAPVQCEI